jgi:hypothetical protein
MTLAPYHPPLTQSAAELRERARRYDDLGMASLADAVRKQAARQDAKEKRAKRR